MRDSQIRPAADSFAQVVLGFESLTARIAALCMGATVADRTQAAVAVEQDVTPFEGGLILLESEGIAPHATATPIVLGVRGNLTTGTEVANNAILWRSRVVGTEASPPTVVISNPGTNSAPLAVTVSTKAITVSLETNGSAQAISTAAQVIAAVRASTDANALVRVDNAGASTGVGVVAVASSTALSGGAPVDATSYQIDTEAGTLKALDSAAAAADGLSYYTAARTWESYAGGAAGSAFVHLAGTATERYTGQRAPFHVWKAQVAPTAAFDAALGQYQKPELSGDLVVPTVAIARRLVGGVPTLAIPTGAFEFNVRLA